MYYINILYCIDLIINLIANNDFFFENQYVITITNTCRRV